MANGVWLEGKRKLLTWIGTTFLVPALTAALVKILIWSGVSADEAAKTATVVAGGLVVKAIEYSITQGKVDRAKAKNGTGGTGGTANNTGL